MAGLSSLWACTVPVMTSARFPGTAVDCLGPADVVAAAVASETALRPLVDRDWSLRAGSLDWSVEQTITHMIGATAKYTLYLASQCQHFIGLSVTRWPDATSGELLDSLVPVATGLAADPWRDLLAATGRPVSR